MPRDCRWLGVSEGSRIAGSPLGGDPLRGLLSHDFGCDFTLRANEPARRRR